jgi:hypothetical protein
MLSFYSRALPSVTPGAFRLLNPAPLDEAVDVVLRCDDHHSRQRARLAHIQTGKGKPSPLLERSAQRLREALARGPAAPGEPECVIEVEQMDPDFDLETNAVKFRTVSRVNRHLDDLRGVLDPRAWGQCSDFFDPEKTYRIAHDQGKPVRDRKGNYVRWDGPEPLGESWRGVLRERFDGPGVSVDNVLVIDFESAAEKVVVDYGLYVSERCTLGPFTDVGGLERNAGGAVAWFDESSKMTVVDVTKQLRFHDFTPGDPGEWVDFGDALSMLLAVVGIALVSDKAVLRLCCTPQIELKHP